MAPFFYLGHGCFFPKSMLYCAEDLNTVRLDCRDRVMTDYMNAPIAEVVKTILEDGVIDDNEVKLLKKRLYADDTIDKEEAESLFTINDAVKGKNNAGSWTQLFADAICDFLLADETSPGVVDDEEATWLIEKLEGDGEIDANEKALLKSLQNRAKELSPNLQAKLKAWGI